MKNYIYIYIYILPNNNSIEQKSYSRPQLRINNYNNFFENRKRSLLLSNVSIVRSDKASAANASGRSITEHRKEERNKMAEGGGGTVA